MDILQEKLCKRLNAQEDAPGSKMQIKATPPTARQLRTAPAGARIWGNGTHPTRGCGDLGTPPQCRQTCKWCRHFGQQLVSLKVRIKLAHDPRFQRQEPLGERTSVHRDTHGPGGWSMAPHVGGKREGLLLTSPSAVQSNQGLRVHSQEKESIFLPKK